MNKKRIYIVDDNDLVREGYSVLISLQEDLAICGEAKSAADALDGVPRSECDLVIVDLRLQDGADGLYLLQELRRAHPDLRTLAITAHDPATYRDRALQAGADEFLDKRDAAQALLPTIRDLLAR